MLGNFFHKTGIEKETINPYLWQAWVAPFQRLITHKAVVIGHNQSWSAFSYKWSLSDPKGQPDIYCFSRKPAKDWIPGNEASFKAIRGIWYNLWK